MRYFMSAIAGVMIGLTVTLLGPGGWRNNVAIVSLSAAILLLTERSGR